MSFDKNVIEFYDKGFTIVENIIPENWLDEIGEEILRLERWRLESNIKDGDPKDFGNGYWWKGFDMATHVSPILKKYYESEFTYNLASAFLKTDKLYFFNDEIVTKFPFEQCKFMMHTDCEYGPIPEAAEKGEYRMVVLYWMLDDHTPDNGPIRFQNIKQPKPTEENIWLDHGDEPPGEGWEWTLPKRGDMVVFDGNTLHYSVSNNSGKLRRAWANHFTTMPIGHLPYQNKKHPLESWKWFYSHRFTL